jgi:hypothetical protein
VKRLLLCNLHLRRQEQRSARGCARIQEQPEPSPEQALGFVRRQVLEFRRSHGLARAPQSERPVLGDEPSHDDDNAELRDRQEQRSKRSQGHSDLSFGSSGVAVCPRTRDFVDAYATWTTSNKSSIASTRSSPNRS